MERRRLRVSEEVGNLPDRQRRLGQVPAGRCFARIIQQLLVCHAFVRQPALKGTRRQSEFTADRIDPRVPSGNPESQRTLNLQRKTSERRQSREYFVGVPFEDLPQD